MKIFRSCGVSTIATCLSLTRQDLSLSPDNGDRLDESPLDLESDFSAADLVNESYTSSEK